MQVLKFKSTVAAVLMVCWTFGTFQPAIAGDLKNCIGMSASGTLQCSVVPQIVGPWSYQLPGAPQATPELSSESAAIEAKKGYLSPVAGYTECTGVMQTVGPFDTAWEDQGAAYHRKYDYRTFNTYRRKPVSFSWSRKVSQPGPFLCYPLSASDYVYSQRTVACAAGWYPDDSPETAFCARNEPVEDASCPVGNPVLPALGTKLHSEPDYAGAGAHPLNFTRFYRSRWPVGLNGRGTNWSHNWASEIATVAGAPIRTVRTMRPDGAIRSFTQPAAAAGQPPSAWQADVGLHDQLTELLDLNGRTVGWTLRAFADDSTETYDALGKLLTVRQRNGWTATLNYANPAVPGQLTSVANHFGRQLRFVYDIAGRLSQLLPPGAVQDSGAGSAASPIRYGYQELASLGSGTPGAGQLTSVTWQDGAVKRYHYEDARFVQALTGLTDEVGVRVATYVYDPAGKVAEETKAGGTERVTFSYSGANTQITDYAANGTGTVRAFSFNLAGGIARATNLTSPCPLCGNTAASTTYGDGGTATGGAGALGQPFKTIGHDRLVTFYQYDAAGRETEKAEYPNAYAYDAVRPALSAATRVTSTKWHATWKLPTQVAEPGKVTAYTYDAKGNPTGQSWTATTDASGAAKFAAIKIGSTFATGWAYNTSGLNTSVIEKTGATETGRWTVTYNAAGDTATVNDATNKRTARMTQYDVHGRMLVGTNDVGVPISFTYSSRGLAASKSVSGQNGVFITNAVGNLTRVTMPDGQTLDYTLDQNQKLIDFKLNGVSVTPQMLAQADYPDTQFKARVASVKRTVQSAIESLMSEALAQVIVPGTRAIKPPVFDPATDMLMSPMSDADRRMRELLQAIAKMCECDPTKGYPKPTLTRQSFAHVHQGDMFHFCGRIKVTSPRE